MHRLFARLLIDRLILSMFHIICTCTLPCVKLEIVLLLPTTRRTLYSSHTRCLHRSSINSNRFCNAAEIFVAVLVSPLTFFLFALLSVLIVSVLIRYTRYRGKMFPVFP